MNPFRRIAALILFCVLALSVFAFGASTCTTTWCTNNQVVSTSGQTITVTNSVLGVTSSFEYVITGSPSVMSIVLKGCKNGGTCDSLNTYTRTSSGIAEPTITTVYDYFTVTPTWTGSNISISISTSITTARSGGGGGGGGVPSVFGRSGAVTAQSGDYTAPQVGAEPALGNPLA